MVFFDGLNAHAASPPPSGKNALWQKSAHANALRRMHGILDAKTKTRFMEGWSVPERKSSQDLGQLDRQDARQLRQQVAAPDPDHAVVHPA